MTTRKTTTELRRCTGSGRFGIEAHDADASDFPVQPSQKDGLGRMCQPHWRQYTHALRKAAVARKAAEAAEVAPNPAQEMTVEPAARAPGHTRRATTPTEPEPTAA